jgi:acyl-CoA dehydrogenase family member 9
MDTPTRASARTARDELSFVRSLFFGDIREELVFPYPDVLSGEARETLDMLIEPVRKFMRTRVDSEAIDKQCKIPDDVLEELKALGLFGLQIPEDLGGLGLSNTAYARVFEVVAAYNASVAVTLGGHQSIGLKGILLFGTDAQKQKYLPKLATGEWVAAFALTEPSSGSDAASIRSRAQLSEDGKHFVLNGSKIWITNGGFADVFTVFA